MHDEPSLHSEQDRFEAFILEMRQRTPWPGLDWSLAQWKLPPSVAGSSARKQSVLHFIKRNAHPSGTPMGRPFNDFAKACVCYKAIYRPTLFTGYRRLVVAVQILEEILVSLGKSQTPWTLTAEQFYLAEKAIVAKQWSQIYKWNISRCLQDVARIVNKTFSQAFPVNYNARIRAPKFREGISDDDQAKSMSRMPSDEALEALAGMFVSVVKPSERILLNAIAICATTGMRIGEVLTLAEKCEVRESSRLGLRYWPEKGGEPVVKWIPAAAEPVVIRAVTELRELCSEARTMAQWMDEHPGQVKVDWLGMPEFLMTSELNSLLGFSNRHASKYWARDNNVPFTIKQSTMDSYNLKEVILAVTKHRPESLQGFKQFGQAATIDRNQLVAALGISYNQALLWIKRMGLRPTIPAARGLLFPTEDVRAALVAQRHQGPHRKSLSGKSQFLGESLIVVFKNQLHPRHSSSRYIVHPLSYSTIRLWLGERSREGSLFDRYGLKAKDGARLRITTYHFRHWLNTLAASGGLSDVELARWMGRKDIKQNVHYIHGVVRRNVALAKKAIQDGTIAGPIADTYQRLEAIDRDEFLDGAINAVFLMPHGGCVHNFASRPCPKHFACLDGCSSFFRTVGDASQREALTTLLENMEQSRLLAKAGTGKGAMNWAAHLERRMIGIKKALAVDEGVVTQGNVQVFPEGKDLSQPMP